MVWITLAPPMPIFQAAPKPSQADIEFVVQRAHERILRYLKKCGVITFAAAPGDDEVNAVLGEGFGESDPADGRVTVEFKRPWSDGTRSIGLAPQSLLSRMAA